MLTLSHPTADYDPSVFDRLKYSDAYFLQFNKSSHIGFSSHYILQSVYLGSEKAVEQLKDTVTGYEILCHYVVNFCNAYLKMEKDGLTFINKSSEDHGFPLLDISHKSKKGIKAPPTEEEFFNIIRSEGVAKAVEIFEQAKKIDPDVTLFNEVRMNFTASRYLQAGEVKGAIELLKINVAAYPESSMAHSNLAQAYMKNGEKDLAAKNCKKSLKLNPENRDAVEMLKKLEEK